MDTPEILTKAADVIDEHGWYRGAYKGPNGCVCVMGALSVAAGLPARAVALGGYSQALSGVHLAAERLENWLTIDILTEWNDEVAETPEQVTSALRECAAELKASA